MGVEEILEESSVKKGFFRRNIDFLLASAAYASVSVADYWITAECIREGTAVESNPIIDSYISGLGVEEGIMVPKIAIGAGLLMLGIGFDHYKEGKNRYGIKGKHVMFAGAVTTAVLSPLRYLFQLYF